MEAAMEEFIPKFRVGVVAPGAGNILNWAPYEFYQVVPRGIMLVSTYLSPGLADYTREAVTKALVNWSDYVEQLVSNKANFIGLGGVPISARLGRQGVLELIEQTQKRAKVITSSHLESVLLAMQHLGVKKVALASRWQAELNEAIASYLATAGIQVVSQTTREQGREQRRAMSEVEGMNLALMLAREAVSMAPQADGVFIPGGHQITTHAIVPLERELGKPIFTTFNSMVWNAIRKTGVVPPIQGWGRLLAS